MVLGRLIMNRRVLGSLILLLLTLSWLISPLFTLLPPAVQPALLLSIGLALLATVTAAVLGWLLTRGRVSGKPAPTMGPLTGYDNAIDAIYTRGPWIRRLDELADIEKKRRRTPPKTL